MGGGEGSHNKKNKVHYFLYHILVILVCVIFFCSWKIPYIRASDVGGPAGRQPRVLLIGKVVVTHIQVHICQQERFGHTPL